MIMPRQNLSADMIPGKIRKRGCSSSSVIQSYRFKRAILVGKRGGSTTPVPTWRLMSSRSPASTRRNFESPKYSQSLIGGAAAKAAAASSAAKKAPPVSARKLAATLWEMNKIPSPRCKEGSDDRRLRKELRAREKMMTSRSMHSGSFATSSLRSVAQSSFRGNTVIRWTSELSRDNGDMGYRYCHQNVNSAISNSFKL